MAWKVYYADGSLKTLTDASSGLIGTVPVAKGGTNQDWSASTGIPKLASGVFSLLGLDTDGTLTANSDAVLSTQKAIKTYVDALSALVFKLAQNNNVTGTGNFASGLLGLPKGSTTLQNAFLEFDTARALLLLGDSQRNRAVSANGWCPYAVQLGAKENDAFSNSWAMTVGRSVAIPILVPTHMLLASVSVWQVDTTLARSWGWALYEQAYNNGNASENTATRIAAGSATQTFTATAASLQTITASANTYLAPGVYWLVVQNRHASNSFGMGYGPVGSFVAPTGCRFKNGLADPLPSTLDMTTGWSNSIVMNGVRLNGIVFGESAAF